MDISGLVVTEGRRREPEEGVALCLSGGGFRAMLYHVGVLWRLNELGLLHGLARVSSVSGGSIAAAQLGVTWGELDFDDRGTARAFEDRVVEPLRRLAGTTVDRPAVLSGLLRPRRLAGQQVAATYRRLLYEDRSLQDLPADDEGPRFVINATNMQSGKLWRFSRPYMADYQVGMVLRPTVPLADAVAASSAFPPVLSPFILHVDPTSYTEESRSWDLHRKPYTSRVVLTDGGVYDNLGLETAWKRYRTVIVSDGGGAFQPKPRVARTWGRHLLRTLSVVDSQVRALRRSQVVGSYRQGARRGAYIGIGVPIDRYPAPDTIATPTQVTTDLAAEPTRLRAVRPQRQQALINWGYVAADAAVRSYLMTEADAPQTVPYPTTPA